ncbi:SAM-dependent methyltransferase [Solwaraspora sp. WMMD406]|uniref:SAM-dependent methyltransferase n=1 Tax=Solwaraspora sp. WMMD406 TaxID=3016095 RepID=UPI0024180B59|nr:SAM-dependent methyltransferase [Solwaraspora sp. WMMD406]MDG4766837.1 SAM-dependent methyltransferase [Solwaraspora sp. WMMD406]
MSSEERAPVGVDTTRPSVARVYDYFLGGKDNFAVDRQAAQMALQVTPDGPAAGKANRAFLGRVIRHLVAKEGIRQFLDIGSGLPTQGNVHEIAHQIDPEVRVAYVDSDPMVLAHGRALLGNSPYTTVVQADARHPEQILADPDVRALIDFSQPVGLLLFAILHHINDDEDPSGVAATFRDAVPSGSFMVVSHFHNPGEAHPEAAKKALTVEKIFNQTLGTGRWRQRDEILGYFGDFQLLEPGLVPVPEWRTDPDEEPTAQTDTYYTFVGGVARKP